MENYSIETMQKYLFLIVLYREEMLYGKAYGYMKEKSCAWMST